MDTLRCIHTREQFSAVGNLVGLKENVHEMFADLTLVAAITWGYTFVKILNFTLTIGGCLLHPHHNRFLKTHSPGVILFAQQRPP